jgi:hypothetical protein
METLTYSLFLVGYFSWLLVGMRLGRIVRVLVLAFEVVLAPGL